MVQPRQHVSALAITILQISFQDIVKPTFVDIPSILRKRKTLLQRRRKETINKYYGTLFRHHYESKLSESVDPVLRNHFFVT